MLLCDLFHKCASIFESGDVTFLQGAFARGLLDKDMPDDTSKPAPKCHEIYPWAQGIHKLESASLVGLICYIAKQNPEGVLVCQAIQRCTEASQVHTPHVINIETWNDTPSTTIKDVIDVLNQAALVSLV